MSSFSYIYLSSSRSDFEMSRIEVLKIPKEILDTASSSPARRPAAEAHTICDLPNEIITRIFKAAPIIRRINLALTYKQLARFAACPRVLNFCKFPTVIPQTSIASRTDYNLILHDRFSCIYLDIYNGYEDRNTGQWIAKAPASHLFKAAKGTYIGFSGVGEVRKWKPLDGVVRRSPGSRRTRITRGLVELKLVKARILLNEYERWLNSGQRCFLTLKYRKNQQSETRAE
jgi:hypothetical protein